MKKMSMFALLLALVLVTSYSVSGTYAKYTSTFTGTTDSARVAKWAFEINDTAVTNSFTFDLFNTVNDTDGSQETDVKVGTNETIIAPGTQGSFQIKLANKSEVNAKYSVDYTVTRTANIPVEFSIDGTNWTTDLADVTDVAIGMNGSESTINIQWRWAFEGTASSNFTTTQTDATDTTLGSKATADTITVQAVITATQVD